MQSFDYAGLAYAVPEPLVVAQRRVWELLARPGSWWTGAERVAIAAQARSARAQRTQPAWSRKDFPDSPAGLPQAAVETARRVAADPQQIERDWVGQQVAALGDAAYVEVVAITVCVCAIDSFADALGVADEPLPAPRKGEPDGARNPAAIAAGAYVPMQDPWQGPNVARALSLVPDQGMMFMSLVMQMYGGQNDFFELVWEEGPLSRPQVELLAARVSALNECFY